MDDIDTWTQALVWCAVDIWILPLHLGHINVPGSITSGQTTDCELKANFITLSTILFTVSVLKCVLYMCVCAHGIHPKGIEV